MITQKTGIKQILSLLYQNTPAIIILGLILRLTIIPFTMNWDFLIITKITSKLFNGTLKDVYADSLSTYPALTFLTRYVEILIMKPFLGGKFLSWINSGDLTLFNNPLIFRYLFILKLPIIFLEIITALIFSRLIEVKKRGKFLFFWMVNPLALYTIAAFTNVDELPVFFISLSFYFFYKKKETLSSFFLGIAAAYKFFPLLFLPFLIITITKWKNKISALFVFLIIFIATQLPVLSLPEYWQNALNSTGNRKIFTAVINLDLHRVLILYLLYYFLLFYHFISQKNRRRNYFLYCFYSLIPIFVINAFHVQWVYWFYPFILIYMLYVPKPAVTIICLLLSYFGIIFLSQGALHISMLAPIAPSLWTIDRPLDLLLGKDVEFAVNCFHALFAASLIWIGWQLREIKKGFQI